MLSFRLSWVLVFAFLHCSKNTSRKRNGNLLVADYEASLCLVARYSKNLGQVHSEVTAAWKYRFKYEYTIKYLLKFVKDIDGSRRITKGRNVTDDKGYMVYLVQAEASTRNYDGWICGGSIVTRWYILTSAACVEDVQNMYAISGTRSYVPSKSISKNKCTNYSKKKVVFTCVPKEYVLDFKKVENWSYNDIAVVKVESPFDSQNELYLKYCDYKPRSVKMNYDVKYEEKGRSVILLGYGHKSLWRDVTETGDWNQVRLLYTSSRIYNVKNCKNVYKFPKLLNNIDKYMICTNGSGIIDEKGMPLKKHNLLLRRTHHKPNLKMLSIKKKKLKLNLKTRRQGFCQNDHGGPLVTWIDGEEMVLGVASVFRVNKDRKCVGPYLYTSTARNKMFIECVINDHLTRRSIGCDQPASELGFSIVRRYILWNENENHFVDNMEIRIRPQINMNDIGLGSVKK